MPMELQAEKGGVEAIGNTLSTRSNNNSLPRATRHGESSPMDPPSRVNAPAIPGRTAKWV